MGPNKSNTVSTSTDRGERGEAQHIVIWTRAQNRARAGRLRGYELPTPFLSKVGKHYHRVSPTKTDMWLSELKRIEHGSHQAPDWDSQACYERHIAGRLGTFHGGHILRTEGWKAGFSLLMDMLDLRLNLQSLYYKHTGVSGMTA